MKEERTILADCCEDWIIEWGGFYKVDRAFRCPECATEWTKTAEETYRRADGRSFVRRTRKGPQDAIPYLAAPAGHEAHVQRCCAKILLATGAPLAPGLLRRLVCATGRLRPPRGR